MNDPTQGIFQNGAKVTPFPATSRYFQIETATFGTPEEKTIVYLRRRFVPQPDRFALLQEYTVVQGDRLDNLTAKFVGDPELFWQICDANAAMRPDELTEIIGRTLRITLPEGIPGQTYA